MELKIEKKLKWVYLSLFYQINLTYHFKKQYTFSLALANINDSNIFDLVWFYSKWNRQSF